MGGYITRTVEVCGYKEVDIAIKDLINDIEEKDAKELIIGLIKKFPNLADLILGETEKALKLFPKALKDQLIAKFKKENTPLKNFL